MNQDNASSAVTESTPGLTFFNSPYRPTPHGDEIAVLGVPSDMLVTEQAGTCDGPRALRRATSKVGTYSVYNDRTYTERINHIADVGDVEVNPLDPEQTLARTCRATKRIFNSGATPFLVGGDHTLTYAAVRAAAECYPAVHLLHIDAHFDATDPVEHGCSINHGTYIRNLVQEEVLPASRIFQFGMRGYQWSRTGPDFVRRNNIWAMKIEEFTSNGIRPLMQKLRTIGDSPLYVSLDIDSIDPAFAPGAGEHMPGGFYAREMITILRHIFYTDLSIVGADLVEVNPGADPDGRTCSLAAELLTIMVDGLLRLGSDRQQPGEGSGVWIFNERKDPAAQRDDVDIP